MEPRTLTMKTKHIELNKPNKSESSESECLSKLRNAVTQTIITSSFVLTRFFFELTRANMDTPKRGRLKLLADYYKEDRKEKGRKKL